ncbi:MAG: tetratricopeptide repeat protein [Desulfuromonadaceae bacterium]|nr:tetratricopeptide repeat protein [Desulfuromonadaceae bacterium]
MAFIPVLQIIPLPTIMQDRYCYFPLLGFCGFFGMFIDNYIAVKPFSTFKYILIAVGSVYIVLLPVLARKQTEIWKDPVTLFSETSKKGVGSRYGYYSNFVEYNLMTTCYTKAEELVAAGNPHEALAYYRKALEVDPLHFDSLLRMAFILLNEGKKNAAYQYNIRLTKNFPMRFEGFYSIGQYYAAIGATQKAEEAYFHTLALNPSFLPARKELASLKTIGGRSQLDTK